MQIESWSINAWLGRWLGYQLDVLALDIGNHRGESLIMICRFNKRAAFTVAELLITLAGMALLAAILAPNLGKATTASKVAQARADLRAIKTGLELYKADLGTYVFMNPGNYAFLPTSMEAGGPYERTLERLTTPVSYLDGAAPFLDPFDPVGFNRIGYPVINYPASGEEDNFKHYFYVARDTMQHVQWNDTSTSPTWYFLQSAGPDRVYTYIGTEMNTVLADDNEFTRRICSDLIYDATNGSVSQGGIWEAGGTIEGRGDVLGKVVTETNGSGIRDWILQETLR